MKRVLIVDDEDFTRLVCRRFFSRFADHAGGIEVREAATGEEALALLGRERFDCVVSDYRMGQVSGIDVLAAALREQPSAVRILMSGFADDAIVQGARLRAKIHEFLEKPLLTPDFERSLQTNVVERYCRAGS